MKWTPKVRQDFWGAFHYAGGYLFVKILSNIKKLQMWAKNGTM